MFIFLLTEIFICRKNYLEFLLKSIITKKYLFQILKNKSYALQQLLIIINQNETDNVCGFICRK